MAHGACVSPHEDGVSPPKHPIANQKLECAQVPFSPLIDPAPPMSDDQTDDLDLRTLSDEELVEQMHDDLYDGLKEEIEEGTNILLERILIFDWL